MNQYLSIGSSSNQETRRSREEKSTHRNILSVFALNSPFTAETKSLLYTARYPSFSQLISELVRPMISSVRRL